MIKVGVVGATGYTGQELCRLLWSHPEVAVTRVFSKSYVGKQLAEICPNLYVYNITLEEFDPSNLSGLDLVFLALPHGQSNVFMKDLLSSSTKVIDLSADFRLKDSGLFNKYYKIEHQSTDIMDKFSIGFPELYKKQIKELQCCANPGCYSTAAILGLFPLAEKKLLNNSVIIDAKSGASGAGKALKESTLFCEIDESITAYGTYVHRHTAEIESMLKSEVFFSPHLIPMKRGILSSMYVNNYANLTKEDVLDIYNAKYENEPFILIKDNDDVASTKNVIGTNMCEISFKVFPEAKKIVVFSAIDNLMKGAAGQAIQNMNLMLGFDETLALPKLAML
jgi:N-acetyl-gamma-glutamyl-phosphate reductase